MVEARPSGTVPDSNDSESSAQGQMADESMVYDEDVVLKPRTNFSASVLQRVAPPTDLAKKKASMTQSLINMGTGGRSPSRLFIALRSSEPGDEKGRHKSSHTISKQISFSSPNDAFGVSKRPARSGVIQPFQNQKSASAIPEEADEDD